MAHPFVQARLNRRCSGDPGGDAYNRLSQVLLRRGFELPLHRCISLGCGFGGLERHLLTSGIVRSIDAYDIAETAIAEARRLAEQAGLTGVRYHVVDMERFTFPQRDVDVVFAHQSVHHVETLEALFAKVRDVLRPGGIFHLHEFVGPTRFQWTDAQLALINGFLDALPPDLRRQPNGLPRPGVGRPTVDAMIAADPSEAIRSADIIAVLKRYFAIIEHARLGGALLHMGLGEIAQNFDPARPDHLALLEEFARTEDDAMAREAIGSDFDVITALRR